MERARLQLSDGAKRARRNAKISATAKGRNGGKREGAGRPTGSRHRIKTSERHISMLSRPWTGRIINDCCLLAFGTTDPEEPGNKKLITQDPWLRFTIMRFLMERAWGRAPLEVKFETTPNVNIRYTREELAKLTLEQI